MSVFEKLLNALRRFDNYASGMPGRVEFFPYESDRPCHGYIVVNVHKPACGRSRDSMIGFTCENPRGLRHDLAQARDEIISQAMDQGYKPFFISYHGRKGRSFCRPVDMATFPLF